MNAYNRIFFILSFLLLGLNHVIAQVPVIKSINKVILEGKVYYIHVVKPGQTLYSISEAYEISIEEIVSENPGVDKSLPAGQVLKIPATPKIVKPSPIPEPAIDSMNYIQHIILPGETLYSLAKKYATTVQEIEKANQGLNYTDLPIGRVIFIPTSLVPGDQQEFILHKVKRRETIYGISRFYKISEEELKAANPELRDVLPRRGQVLRIPKIPVREIARTDETQTAVIQDTLIPMVPVKDSFINVSYDYYLDSLPDFSGRPINVAYLIPFNFTVTPENEIQDSLNTLATDMEEEYEEMLPESVNLLEFLEGSLVAIDHLRQKGISLNVNFYDTRRSSDKVREIINSNDFDKTDIIIGPFHSYNVEIVSEYSRQHHIPLISPFHNDTLLSDKNPFLFQACPSLTTEYDHIANYLSTAVNKNIIFIHSPDSLELKKIDYLRSAILEGLWQKGNLVNTEFKELTCDIVSNPDFFKELSDSLSKSMENLVVIPETDEVLVKKLISTLYFQLKKYKIKVVGMSEWTAYDQSIENYTNFHNLELSYFTPYYYSYDSRDIKHFLKEFSREFFTEPVTYSIKGCPYAYLGYGLSYYFLSSMNKYGRHFIMNLHDNMGGQLMNDFRFEKTPDTGGFENLSLMLIKLMPDMSIEARKMDAPKFIKNSSSGEEPIKDLIQP